MSKLYVGVDVSKRSLDCYFSLDAKYVCYCNDKDGISQLAAELAASEDVMVVMEATGGYEMELFCVLAARGIAVSRVNPARVRSFARACGKLAKTDKVDSQLIAWFAQKIEVRVQTPQNGQESLLRALVARRGQLISMRTAEFNRREHARETVLKRSVGRVITFLDSQLQEVEAQIKRYIDKMPELKARQQLLESVKGVGSNTAAMLVAELPELGRLNRRQVAALAGIAPINRDSGQFRGKRMTGGGRCRVRTCLFMPTLVAVRFNPQLRSMYNRLLENGKAKMVAVIACMRKLLLIMNQMLANNQKWRGISA